MAKEQLAAFVQAVAQSQELKAKVQSTLDGSEDAEDFAALGRAEGFDFSAEEAETAFQEIFSTGPPRELSDDELERVAGGKGGGTLIDAARRPLDIQTSVSMLKGLKLERPPGWLGFDFT